MRDRTRDLEELMEALIALKRAALAAMPRDSIPPSQWLVMGHIVRNEGCTTTDLARALRMTGSAATQLVNGLVAEGLVVRESDPRDRRAHRLMLSAASRRRIKGLKRARMRALQRLFAVLDDRELAVYIRLMRKIIPSLKKPHDEK